MRRRELLGGLAIGAFGVLTEWPAIVDGQPSAWIPDLMVGLVFLATAMLVRRTSIGTALLLGAVAVTWFAGNLTWIALFWHRGPLFHLLLAYPGWRARGRTGQVLIGIAYVAAVLPFVWASESATIALSVVLIGGVVLQHRTATGPARGFRPAALAAGAVGTLLVAGAVLQSVVPSGAAVQPTLWAYEATLAAVAIGVAADVRRLRPEKVEDLVVELGETRSGTLRDALARALGDPTLQVGFWSALKDEYADAVGSPVVVPAPGARRSATYVTRDGGPFAVLVHDATILDDPDLAKAVADATRLTASHVALRTAVRDQLAELAASRRRLLVAGDDERQRIEQRLHDGARGRLVRMRAVLRSADADGGLGQASGHLDGSLADLDELARGLHPRALANGLGDALAALLDRGPIPSRLMTTDRRYPPEVEVTVYYVCAEALANVAKYAAASHVSVEVAQRLDWLWITIADDGVGGADRARGSGLVGLIDRVEALGGTLTVHSPPGEGTRIVGQLPLEHP
ncbi:hypothetical protein OG809_35345 [Kribbella soli]